MSDLQKLIEAVECGDLPQWMEYIPFIGEENAGLAGNAGCGSLDAAKALHESLLPGWKWGVVDHADGDFGSGVGTKDVDDFLATSSNPARAWLLAIIRAYAAQQVADAITDRG